MAHLCHPLVLQEIPPPNKLTVSVLHVPHVAPFVSIRLSITINHPKFASFLVFFSIAMQLEGNFSEQQLLIGCPFLPPNSFSAIILRINEICITWWRLLLKPLLLFFWLEIFDVLSRLCAACLRSQWMQQQLYSQSLALTMLKLQLSHNLFHYKFDIYRFSHLTWQRHQQTNQSIIDCQEEDQNTSLCFLLLWNTVRIQAHGSIFIEGHKCWMPLSEAVVTLLWMYLLSHCHLYKESPIGDSFLECPHDFTIRAGWY
jgi:hypothetical protein